MLDTPQGIVFGITMLAIGIVVMPKYKTVAGLLAIAQVFALVIIINNEPAGYQNFTAITTVVWVGIAAILIAQDLPGKRNESFKRMGGWK